jgi:hypothetical protein
MKLSPCPHEKEIRELLARGQWTTTSATSAELRDHAKACSSCSDLVLISAAFRDARAASAATVRMIPPGVLWWRAQLRRREAAVERITRPLLGAQVFALAFTLLAGVGFFVFEALTRDSWRSWLEQFPQSAALDWSHLLASAATDPVWAWMILGPTMLLLGGVAAYLATDRQ